MSTTQPIRSREELELFKSYYEVEKPDERNYMLVVMGLNSALRISDILHLTYGDVYDYGKEKWKRYLVVEEQKTGKTNRIYMNNEICNVLRLVGKPQEKTAASWLFESQKQKNKPLSRYQAYRIVRKAAAFAGLEEHISCHSLRKTFGYHAWKQGTAPALLMNIYNHSSFQITKGYLCIDQDDRDQVFEKILL